MKPYFLNVDFELRSLKDMASLAFELKDKIEILVNEKIDNEYCLNFELVSLEDNSDPARTIYLFFDLINNLSTENRRIFDACGRKVIDIGYHSGSDGWLYNTIPNETLKDLLSEGFHLNISIYGGVVI